jgi:uncharacterized pyridoxamine 5'-phosphate oxidase family protein
MTYCCQGLCVRLSISKIGGIKMDFAKEFDRIMAEQTEIALATCIDRSPNVRIVNFCFKNDSKGILYFSTFADNQKVSEFVKDASVAFTTIPHEGNAMCG